MGSLRVGYDWVTLLSLSCIGEGNGNPLQCSFLENPRDGGAWWASFCGVAQSRTRLKLLSSSSSSSTERTQRARLGWFWCGFIFPRRQEQAFFSRFLTCLAPGPQRARLHPHSLQVKDAAWASLSFLLKPVMKLLFIHFLEPFLSLFYLCDSSKSHLDFAGVLHCSWSWSKADKDAGCVTGKGAA